MQMQCKREEQEVDHMRACCIHRDANIGQKAFAYSKPLLPAPMLDGLHTAQYAVSPNAQRHRKNLSGGFCPLHLNKHVTAHAGAFQHMCLCSEHNKTSKPNCRSYYGLHTWFFLLAAHSKHRQISRQTCLCVFFHTRTSCRYCTHLVLLRERQSAGLFRHTGCSQDPLI